MNRSWNKVNVIISAGVGRLHFIDVGKALLARGCHFTLVCGILPNPRLNSVLCVAGKLLGRPNLAKSISARAGEGGTLLPLLRSNALAEGFSQLLLRLADLHLLPRPSTQALSWRFYGWRTRRYFAKQAIFHVRTGGGQGGAIAEARARGMRIIADQSIAHPAYVTRVLAPEWKRFGAEKEGRLDGAFWDLVVQDCLDADVILVNSDFVKKTLVDNGFSADKIKVLYLGTRLDFMGVKKDYQIRGRAKLLFTGTFELRKGLRILIEALEMLVAEGIDCELHVAGNPAESTRFFGDRIARLPIIMHGILMQDDLKQLLADADIYVFPTLAEGCAKSAMEAMFAGLPVVTTEACGLPGRPGEDYEQVPVLSSLALTAAIKRLLGDEDARRGLGAGGLRMAKSGDYSWDMYAKKLMDFYAEQVTVDERGNDKQAPAGAVG